ncbi:MAG TPA: cytochrome c biogenesis protein CcsA [Methylibium sp.]|nr:cytochrome c biogenesis protein CcsA [Methylibium sp.]
MSLSPAAASLFPLVSTSTVALLAYGMAALKRQSRWMAAALGIGWAAHGLAILLHAFGVGEVDPGMRFGFAPALSATLWLVIMVYAIESRYVPLAGVARGLALLGAAVVVLAVVFPGELRPHAGSPWAPVHWVLGIASYGLFGAALLHAALLRRAEARMRGRALGADAPPAPLGLPLLGLEKLTFHFVAAGFVALSATLLLGWWFASPWHWDHKTVFSMLAWAVFAALLIGRRAFGWRGRRATRWLYAGGALLLLAYAGSRFVIEVLLHRAG